MDERRLIKVIQKFMDLYGPKDPNYRHNVEEEGALGDNNKSLNRLLRLSAKKK